MALAVLQERLRALLPGEHRAPLEIVSHEIIFEKFGRGEKESQRVQLPTGLGLAFCKMVLDAHGGSIGVASHVGEGSTFWFEIPNAPQPGGTRQ